MKVVVVGGGIVGLCCAYELAARGAEVTVLERGRAGHGTSLGNTGWVCPSFTYPLPAPGVVTAGLKGLVAGGGPLVIHPSLDPTFVRWLWLFRRSASRSRWERGVAAFVGLNARTLELFDAYAEAGVDFEMHRSGLLLVARTSDGLTSYAAMFEEIGRFGYDGQIATLGPAEACELEPALDVGRITGGMHTLIDRYVRPESLTAGLAAYLRARGVELREGVSVTGIRAHGDRVRVLTDDGPLPADRAVVAAGPSSRPMLAALGVRVPLVGARGYSVTIPGGAVRPRHALYLAEAKVGLSSYEDAVRIAGVFELGHKSDALDPRRLRAMIAGCEPYFGDWRPSAERVEAEWAGLRPMTADGLPLIGPAPTAPNVFLATGHGMLGVTLAPATAALLTPLVLEGVEAPELEPFRPDRTI
jgi:D-amino-acid dehydrogenase